MTTTGYATPVETSHNTRIHDGKLNGLINIVRQISPTPGLPGSAPLFTQREMLPLEIMFATWGEKTNVMVYQSIHLYFSAYPGRIVVAVDLRRCSGHFLATISDSSWGPKSTARS